MTLQRVLNQSLTSQIPVCALNCAHISSLLYEMSTSWNCSFFAIRVSCAAFHFFLSRVYVAHHYFYLSSCLATDNNLHVYGMASATYVDNLISIMFIDDFEWNHLKMVYYSDYFLQASCFFPSCDPFWQFKMAFISCDSHWIALAWLAIEVHCKL